MRKRAVIIGAGPAGLTAAYELLKRTDIEPLVLEASECVGGISRTVNYKGNRLDVGGHRFFSKSDRVMKWWLKILPLEATGEIEVAYQGQTARVAAGEGSGDRVMLVRKRKSRIYFQRQFFTYPIQLSGDTLRKLGLWKTARIGLSYLRAALFPIRDERTLEQFFINRFGRELYVTFFKSYTEKVWGIPCSEISAEWGAQRIKGLSITKTVAHALTKRASGLAQKETETSLIERFLYPKFGPGQMWEEVAKLVTVEHGWRVEEIECESDTRVSAVIARHTETGERRRFVGDYFFSTMPVKDLVRGMRPPAPQNVREVAEGLVYRDFMTVGVLCSKVRMGDLQDNWIYIQEPDVRVGRLQIFNNWSPAMVADPATTWIGMEYFCNETDELWRMSDNDVIALAKRELAALGIADESDVTDATVIRMAKTYPAYFGSYERFGEIIEWADKFENLFLIGRNGMHKYNNQDHSMLAAMTAVDNIVAGLKSKSNLWALNTESEYHEAATAEDRE